jgi:hypothetical protein
MNYYRLIAEAVETHKRLIQYQDAGVVDAPLQEKADRIHEIFYTKAPSGFFQEYVLAVHARTGRYTWLCGRDGVNEFLKRLGVNW